jgi:hypothetical protein
MIRFAPAAAAVACLAACSSAPTGSPTTAPSTPPPATAISGSPVADEAPSRPARWSRERVVQSRSSYLLVSRVERTSDGLRVMTAWSCGDPRCGRQRAIAVGTDGFRTARYLRWTRQSYDELFGPARLPPDGLEDDGRMAQPVVSLAVEADRHQVATLGSDGATLYPFEAVARSADAGRTWTTREVERGEAMPYVSGNIVLPDGRMLALIGNWSSDRRRGPGPEHHGLWVSTDPDLTRYTPYEPSLDPQPAPPDPELVPPLAGPSPFVAMDASAQHGGIIWLQSWDARLWVSEDGNGFREIPAR